MGRINFTEVPLRAKGGAAEEHCSQYFGTDGSTSLDQAVMPPFKLIRRPGKPAFCSASIALALRTPPLQCTTVSREGSISFRRLTTWANGINLVPAMRAI